MSLHTSGISMPAMTVLGHRKNGSPIYNIAGGAPEPGEGGEPVFTIPTPAVETQPPAEARFTAADLERVRQEEKTKLYGRIQSAEDRSRQFESELTQWRTERETAQAAEAEAQRQAAEQERLRTESEMSAKELLSQREQEWNDRFSRFEQEREMERAQFAKEQEFANLQQYTQRRVAEERDNIAPELLDLVNGNTPEEIEASLVNLKGKTEAILQSVQQAQIQARSQMRGVSPTGYSTTGPMDSEPGHKTLSLTDIRNMPMDQWAQIRGSLGIGNAAQNNRGMYS